MDFETLCINTIRMLAADMVQKANSGHPGMPMGAAPMAYVLWSKAMKYNPADPKWPDRDRFLLSAGHGSALLYSMLHLTGYDLPMEQLKNFRQWGSQTPGHPEYGRTPGVECTTGPLGQGFANGVGMAIAERHLAARFNQPGHEIVDHYTFSIVSDGDIMEGIASEAASLAGQFRLGKLIYLYDNNHITLAGETSLTLSENVGKRFEAYGWHFQAIEDGNDTGAILKAINAAKEEKDRPSLISVRTHIGFGSPHKQDTFEVHGSPLGEDELKETKKNLGWPVDKPFYIPDEVQDYFRKATERGKAAQDGWGKVLESYGKASPEMKKLWDQMMGGMLSADWEQKLPSFKAGEKVPTRKANGKAMNAIADYAPFLIGGSGDLNPSTFTQLDGKGTFEPPRAGGEKVQGSVGPWSYAGRNIAYGVREHAMCGITSGLALHEGLVPYASTFLIFSDYARASIRLACLMELKVIYAFTHDSVMLGEDGPTHQPIEHLASLRAMPNMTVIRPADANEAVEAWKAALLHEGGPVSLVLTRQKLDVIDRSRYAAADGLHKGAYILAGDAEEIPEVILIATGSEVNLALAAYKKLASAGVKARVVSMPCWNYFDSQPDSYKNKVLPPEVTGRVAIEAAATLDWYKYVGLDGAVVGIDGFGASAPEKVNLEKFGFTVDHVLHKAKEVMARKVAH